MKKGFILLIFLIFFILLLPKEANATISSAKDVLSTSRPSAGTPLNSDHVAASLNAAIVDNGSLFLASDSAILRNDTGETLNNVSIASMSAATSGVRTIFFTAVSPATTTKHHKGSAVIVPITATHTISFTTGTGIVAGGHVVITFPALGGTDTIASSPSAQTFMFNGIATGQISWSGVACDSVSTTAPTIDCIVDGSGVAAGTPITVTVGTVGNQRLINPTTSTNCLDTAPAGTCNADAWKISLRTQDASAADIESTTIKAATIQSVLVQALVEPTITFTIAGLTTANNYDTIAGGSACGSETSNAGIDSTSTSVNLGLLTSGGISHAGQKLTVSTNASSGYSITATSSGRFIDKSTGQFLPDANVGNGLTANDTPAAGAITAATAAFGISPCGDDVSFAGTPDWGTSGGTVASGASFSNPWNPTPATAAYYATVANYTAGVASSRVTVVRYGATINTTTPAGLYSTVLTYVATATF